MEKAALTPGAANNAELYRAVRRLGLGNPLRHRMLDALELTELTEDAEVGELKLITNIDEWDASVLQGRYDIPVEMQPLVAQYIRFFQGPGRRWFRNWMNRSTRYIPVMQPILEKHGVPRDTVYLAMIESGFSTHAYSRARAAGMWQFIKSTGKLFGLHQDFWVDERQDFVKATVAAAHYLRQLHDHLGHWYLAWAGYNAGGGRIQRVMDRLGTRDFWELAAGKGLAKETQHYVPKLIAAALIAKHPERFGFHVDYEQPPEIETVQVPDATDLHVIAKLAGISIEQVRDLNPELRRFCTPPGGWTLRLPRGTGAAFVAEYAKLGPAERLSFVEHKVERGEPINQIARAYGVSEAAILKTNGLKSYRQIKVGRVLVIPVHASSGLLAGRQLEKKGVAVALAPKARAAAVRARVSGSLYTVQPGDSLWTIAAKFSTTVDKLKRLNGLNGRRARELQVGQTIAVRES